ncbi:hypothetical protein A2V49_02250 [candidate division WWE3 bacterium RBG_19FT_COMBO_34_6]|uniref:Polysaccharide biosynthesis protein C-terminal domain-containing protein n=1 Tax=candidate division WWE3 bacterium RBG_19FT_COMBO_34_6 TaxID=1802612 RepID=A0A1F4ULL1_UNCKA|nr:MAG: hypothetical protein A2V49_02250 [candidate division WWE3 bacterium RBG_19FT_COMBO_34_6]
MVQIGVEETIKKIFSGTVVVTVGLFVNSFFSYLLHIYLGRSLTLEEYGIFNTLLSIFYLFNVFTSVISVSIIKIVSELLSQRKIDKLTAFYWKLVLYLSALGLVIFISISIFKNLLAEYLNITESNLFIFLGFYTLTGFLAVTMGSYVQGLLRFKLTALYYALSGILRFALPVLFIYLGFKVNGVFFALGLGVVVCFFIITFFLQKNFEYSNEKIDVSNLYKRVLDFSIPVFFVSILMQGINTIDLLLVKKFFTGDLVGYYSGVVTIGKIILFGAGSITIVMFPQISALMTSGKDYLSKFKFFLLLQILITLIAYIIFSSFPGFITTLFFGDRFSESVLLLPRFVLYISLYVCSNFFITFLLAINKTNVYRLLFLPVILQIILIYHFHGSLLEVININIIATIILLVSLLVYLYKVITAK